MDKWRRSSARRNIARKHEIVELRERIGIKPRQRESDTNYSHRVWENNKDQPWMTPDSVKAFHAGVVFECELVRELPDYQYLLDGTASNQLIAATLGNYYAGRRCLR